MPISAPSSGGDNSKDPRFQEDELYDAESLACPGLSAARAEALLKRLGAGVAEKHERVEGLGWQARIEPTPDGVVVHFQAHDELLDDLLRRFEQHVEREMGR